MKTVLITGASGYIGSHVTRALAKNGVRVIALDQRKGEELEGVQWVVANLFSDEFALSDYVDAVPDVCLHMAWRNGFDHNNESHMLDLSGHYRFLLKMMDLGVRQIAVMGSMHEVGYWEGAIAEDTPCNPQSLYGISKDSLRRAFLLEAARKGVVAQWLRGFYIYGDDEGSQSIFGKIVRAAKAGETHFPFTSGKNKYDFLSVQELSEQIAACVLQDEVAGIINCCSGKPLSLGEMIERFIADHGLNITLDYGKYPDRPYDSPGVWGDATKIDKVLGR